MPTKNKKRKFAQKTNKDFNIIIAGVGGQGIITLLQIIAEAALIDGYDVKTSELHGLSQRSGGVEVHIRLGEKIYSPLIPLGGANLILALEMTEGLRAVPYSGAKTTLLINKNYIHYHPELSEEKVKDKIKLLAKSKANLISASEICQKKLGSEVVSGIYLLGWGIFKKKIPLKPNSILKAISKIVPKNYLELNKKAFNLAKSD